MDDRTGGVGHKVDQSGFRPLPVEFGEGGEHAAAKLHAAKSGACGFADLFNRRPLRTLGARLPGFQVSRARDVDPVELQPSARRRGGDRRQRRSRVQLVRDDDLHDDSGGDGLADLSTGFELGKAAAVARVDPTDKKARIDLTQGIGGGERCGRLLGGQRHTKIRHRRCKVATERDRDVAARLLAVLVGASGEGQPHRLFVPAALGERVPPG